MTNDYDKANPLMMSAEILVGCEQAAEELGINLEPSLLVSGLSEKNLSGGDTMLPLHKVVDFLNDLAERSACEHLGLIIAKHQPPARFSMIGQLVRFSENLGMAIHDAVEFSLLNSEFTRWETQLTGDTFSLIRNTRALLDAPMFQLRTLAIALVYKAINAICQRRITLKQVHFALKPPTNPAKFEQFFNAPVLFNQLESSLVLPVSALDTPIPTADSKVRSLLIEHLVRLSREQSAKANIVERVTHYIEKTVGSRQCHLEAMCANWGVHPRALQRSLHLHNKSFRTILLSVRQQLAEQYLRDSSISVTELSDILGYANPSAFSRAFKAATGLAPDPWRLSQKDTSNIG